MTWLKVNARPIGAVIGMLGMLGLVHFWPELKSNQAVIQPFVELLSVALIALVPGLRSTKRSTDE